jgi:Replication protein
VRTLKKDSQGFLSKELSLWNRIVVKKLLVGALLATKFHKHLAEKVENCHSKYRRKECDQGHRWAAPGKAHNSCSVRLCPHCAHRKATKKAMTVQKFLIGRQGARYVVLSERNCKNLAQGIRSLYQAWTSLRRSVCWKEKVKGAIVVLEVTYNKKHRTWHPHLNVLFEGEYFPFELLKQAWVKATNGRGRQVYIKAADTGTAFELIKYTLKVAELKDSPMGKVYEILLADPAALDEFLSATYGCRLIRTYGTFRKMKVEDDDEEVDNDICPDCGSNCVIDKGPAPPMNQLSFDFDKGVFRLPDKIPWICGLREDVWVVRNPESVAIAVEARRFQTHYERSVSESFIERAA